MRDTAHKLPLGRFSLLGAIVLVIAGSSAAVGGPDGLVAAYSFDGSGSTLTDDSGNGNTGSIVGAEWSATGRNGRALSFNGVSDLVTVADSASLDLTTGMTVEAWVRPTGSAQRPRTVAAKLRSRDMSYGLTAGGGESGGFGFSKDPPGAAGRVFVSNSRAAVGPVLPLGTWTHLATTHDGSTLRLYVNGSLAASRSAAGNIRTSTNPLTIGANGNNDWFAGELDDLRIYNRALGQTEIQGDMSAPVRGDTTAPGAPSGLRLTRQSQTEIDLAWTAPSDNVGVTGYGQYVDGVRVASGAGTNATFRNLACGRSYTFAVDAVDAAGNRSDRTTVGGSTSPCTDTVPPSAPSQLAITGRNETAITISWSAATDNVGVTGYTRFLDGASLSTAPGTTFTYTGLACDTSYVLGVEARDAAGNRSSRSSVTATTSPCPTTAGGMVAAYSFDAGSGSTLADASGNGRHGTISGATWTTTGRSGGALSFDGVNDLVTIADAASLDLTTGMTLEAWVRPTADGSWRTVVTKEQSGNLVYGLFSNSDSSQPASIVSIGSSPNQDIARGTNPVGTSAWTHLATTYDGTTLRLYLNGTQVGTKTVSGAMPNSSRPLQIGGNTVWPEWFQGQIDELRIYNRALSGTEIQADMSAPMSGGSPAPAPEPAPVPTPGDTQAPSVPAGLGVSGQTETALTLGWSASTDNVGVSGYSVYRDGSSVGSTNASTRTYTFTGLTCGTTYTLAVDSSDAAGNRSAKASASGTTTACAAPPPPPPPPPSSGGSVAAGQSWQAAYDAAAAGSVINVLAGNHGTQRVNGSKQVTFLGQSGAVMRQFWNYANGLTLDNVDIDGNAQKLTILESHGDNAIYRNLEIRNNTDVQMVGNYGANASYDNVFFHDAVETTAGENAGIHMECVWSNGPSIKVRNSVFKDCAIMDLYLTLGTWWTPPQQPYTNVVVEDNIFWPSERTNNQGTHFYGFTIIGQLPINGWTIRRNRFDNSVGVESSVSNSTICGNAGSAPTSWKTTC